MQDFWKFLVSLQLHRQLQQPQPLLDVKEQQAGFTAVPFLYDQMKQKDAADEAMFRQSTVGETMIEKMLDELS